MTYKYDLAVFIGRFEPFHNGHKAVIQEGLAQANKMVVIVGSSGSPRSYRNPFTYEERVGMIKGAFPDDANRIITMPIEDTIYNDEKWMKDVQETVTKAFVQAYGGWHPMAKTALIGHSKDNSSFYLKLFPQWDSISVKNVRNIDATTIRESYFSNMNYVESKMLPSSTVEFLNEFKNSEDYLNIVDEYAFVNRYKESWAVAPFPPTFVTVDAVVVQSGHVLLVQRGARPGKGQWALPGGFLNQNEKIVDAVIRELREETKIKVPAPVLKGNIVASRVFDDPHRSSRGRTITHAYLIHLSPDRELPKVKGSDDAMYAKWIPLANVKRSEMYEDHYDLIQSMTDLL